jgi:hypothetical protein
MAIQSGVAEKFWVMGFKSGRAYLNEPEEDVLLTLPIGDIFKELGGE